MAQYINKSALGAEIERLIRKYSLCSTHTDYEKGLKEGRLIGYKDVLFKVNTSEMKEVDLEKELEYNDYMNFFKEHPDYSNRDWGFDECWMFAKHFFKLGLKAKGE